MKLKVSIIIPMFNSGAFIIEMIACIKNQTFSNWELIIVDDISTDHTFHTVEEYIRNDNRIKLIQRGRLPKGAQTCRNIGFENSIGEYVVFFDADDLISKNCIKQRVRFMDVNPELDFGIFPAVSFKENIEILNVKNVPKYGYDTDFDTLTSFLNTNYKFTVWTNIYKRRSILDISWDEKVKVLQDFDFIISTLLSSKEYAFCDNAEVDYFYRISANDQSISSNFISDAKCESTIYLFDKVLKKLKIYPNFKKRKKEFLRFLILHFERLVMGGSKLKIKEYLNFCRRYYPISVIFSLQLIFKLTLVIKNQKIRKAVLYFILFIRFGYYKYMNVLFGEFKKKIL